MGDAYAWLRAVRADQSHVGRVQRSRAYGSLRDALSPEPGPGGIAQAEDAVDSVDDKGRFLLWTIPGIRRNAMVCAVPGCTFVFTYRQAHPPSALPEHTCVDVSRPTLPERAATAAMQMVAEAGLTVMGRPHSGAGDGAVRLPQPLAVGWARKERRTIKQLHAEIKAQLCAMFDEGLLAAKVSAEAAVERLRAQRRSGALACADRDIPKVRQVRLAGPPLVSEAASAPADDLLVSEHRGGGGCAAAFCAPVGDLGGGNVGLAMASSRRSGAARTLLPEVCTAGASVGGARLGGRGTTEIRVGVGVLVGFGEGVSEEGGAVDVGADGGGGG